MPLYRSFGFEDLFLAYVITVNCYVWILFIKNIFRLKIISGSKEECVQVKYLEKKNEKQKIMMMAEQIRLPKSKQRLKISTGFIKKLIIKNCILWPILKCGPTIKEALFNWKQRSCSDIRI